MNECHGISDTIFLTLTLTLNIGMQRKAVRAAIVLTGRKSSH